MSETPDPTEPGAPSLPEGIMQMPLVILNNVALRIDELANGEKMIVVGPLALAIPMSAENERWLRERLNGSGITIADASALSRL